MAKKFEFEGQSYEFPDDATDDEILGLIGNSAPKEQPQISDAGRVGGFLTRYGVQGAVQGVAGLPAMVGDAFAGVGRDIAYGGKLALSKTGAVEAPDPKNYYGEGSAFPASAAVSDVASRAGRAATGGLIEPESGMERVAAAGIEGGVSALTGAGVGSFLARLGTATGNATARGVGSFLAADPAIQAASGVAAGAAGTGAAESPVVREKLPDWAPGAIGMAAGVGTGAALAGGRAALGYDPTSKKYIRSTNREGQTRLRNHILQDMAENPEVAARNLEARTAAESAPDFVFPGYREITPAAAQDPGLAQQSPLLHMYAQSDAAGRARDNSIAVNRRFVLEGAGEGAAEGPRRQARDFANRDLAGFGLTGQTAGRNEAIQIDDILAGLDRRTRGDRPGTTSATRDVNREARNALEAVAERREVPTGRTLANGEPEMEVQRFATPERIYSVTGDLSESLAPPKPGATLPIPSAARARGETGRVKGQLDDVIGEQVGTVPGPQGTEIDFPTYNARQRGLRQESDERSFLRALLEDIGPNTDPVTGGQMIQAPKMGRFFNEKNANRAIPGSQSGTMSISRLSPARQQFLREAEEVGQIANYPNAPGTGARGSNSVDKSWNQAGIAEKIRSGQAPYERVLDAVSRTPILGQISRGVGSLFRQGAKTGLERAGSEVERMLGQTYTNREAAIEALRGPTLPQRGVGISARRGAERGAQYGAQGFLAEQRRRAEERQRRYR